MNEALQVRAFAKVNLYLDVTGKRENGYHTVDMVMQSVDYSDLLVFRVKEGGDDFLSVEAGGDPGRFPLPDAGDDNLVFKAVKLLRDRYGIRFPKGKTLDIKLKKSIPSEAGLGGGSADAAATLLAVNQLFGLALTDKELHAAALALGADVPFCLRGGTMRARGIGDELTKLTDMPECSILIVKPTGGASTKAIYEAIDEGKIVHPDITAMERALESGDIGKVSLELNNVMESVTAKLVPPITNIVDLLMEAGALGARMTGSGTAVFGVFFSDDEAFEAMKKLHAVADELEIQDVMMTRPVSAREIRDRRILPYITEELAMKYGKKQLAVDVSVCVETASETGSSIHKEETGGLATVGSDDRINKVFFEMSGGGIAESSENELAINPDKGSVTLSRQGTLSQTFEFLPSETTDATMVTPYGNIALTLKTDKLIITSKERELKISAEYSFAESPFESHTMSIEVKTRSI